MLSVQSNSDFGVYDAQVQVRQYDFQYMLLAQSGPEGNLQKPRGRVSASCTTATSSWIKFPKNEVTRTCHSLVHSEVPQRRQQTEL